MCTINHSDLSATDNNHLCCMTCRNTAFTSSNSLLMHLPSPGHMTGSRELKPGMIAADNSVQDSFSPHQSTSWDTARRDLVARPPTGYSTTLDIPAIVITVPSGEHSHSLHHSDREQMSMSPATRAASRRARNRPVSRAPATPRLPKSSPKSPVGAVRGSPRESMWVGLQTTYLSPFASATQVRARRAAAVDQELEWTLTTGVASHGDSRRRFRVWRDRDVVKGKGVVKEVGIGAGGIKAPLGDVVSDGKENDIYVLHAREEHGSAGQWDGVIEGEWEGVEESDFEE